MIAGVLSIALIAGTGFALLLGIYSDASACDPSGTEVCSRALLNSSQMIVSVLLVLPVALTVHNLLRARRCRAAAWLMVSLLLGLLFAGLNDAQTHGWDNLKVF